MARVALITGIFGQDGSYLAENLLGRGYRVVGADRGARHSVPDYATALLPQIELIECDIRDARQVSNLIERSKPQEVYNFAAISSGARMLDDPCLIDSTNGFAVGTLLQALMQVDPSIRFCQAGSREVFGDPVESPQNETTPCIPRNFYGAAKMHAMNLVRLYREHFGMHASNAILFNHESPRRGADFVTRKVVQGAVEIFRGKASTLVLGNLDSLRDWGFAPDFVEAMRLMVQADSADDYVVATGEVRSIAQLCETAFGRLGLDWRRYVSSTGEHARGKEPVPLVGDATRLRKRLGWAPSKTFEEIVNMMVDCELERQTNCGGVSR